MYKVKNMKFKIIFLLIICNQFVFPQQNQLWKSYYSYNEIVDVEGGLNTIFAATNNSIFYKELNLNDLNIYNSINGFKPESVTAIHHSDSFNRTIAGSNSGLILIVNADGSVTTKVDIIEEVPVAPNIKKINDLYEYNGKLYISCDYGISVLNLSNLEFESTYFIGPAGEEVQVLQTTVLNDEIYAVTRSNGIRKANINNPFIYDYSQWQTFDTSFWLGIVTFNNELVALNTNSKIYRYSGSAFIEVLSMAQSGLKLKTNSSEVIVTTRNNVYVINSSYSLIAHVTNIPSLSVNFTAATVVGNQLFLGTASNGLFSTSLSNPTTFENMSPNGPVRNYIFRVKKTQNYLWAVYGDYTRLYNPYPLDNFGISKFSNESGWELIPYDDLFQAKSISDLVVNPVNNNEVYASSYFSGLLKINDDGIVLYNNVNTAPNGLESLVLSPPNPSYVDIRVNSPAFDKDGNLWVTNAFVAKSLKVLRTNGQWQSYDMSAVLPTINTGRYAPMAIDKNRTKWVPTINDGLLVFNDTYNNKTAVINVENGNLPDNDVRCVSIDNRNQLWIGTFKGLRILSSIDRFVSETEFTTTPIIIQEGDLAQELFYQQTILDIAVDGANNKWVSIADGGVFLVSSNGQETIYQFTKSNSPLPSNNIVDIEIDGVSGEVFFATDMGMVSFLGTSTKPSDDLANVFVYPNPVRPNYSGTIKVAGLTDKANIKITDIEGNLVHETTSSGGTIEWDGNAFGSHKVASGVYMIFVSSQDGTDTTVKKVMIIR